MTAQNSTKDEGDSLLLMLTDDGTLNQLHMTPRKLPF